MAKEHETALFPLENLWSCSYGTMNLVEICTHMGDLLNILEGLRRRNYCVAYVDELVFDLISKSQVFISYRTQLQMLLYIGSPILLGLSGNCSVA